MKFVNPKIGDRQGKLVVIKVTRNVNGGSSVECLCECGKTRTWPSCLIFGRVPKFSACNLDGCRQVIIKHGGKVGGVPSPEYRTWHSMIQRCTNPKEKGYRNYGGRGIKVCREWFKFAAFLKDMGQKPSPKHSIDRINNDGNYEPGNCRWATIIQQARNRRTNRLLTCDGVTLPVASWAEKLGVSQDLLNNRVSRKWNHERIIKQPIHKNPH